jgi:hypothetical protein
MDWVQMLKPTTEHDKYLRLIIAVILLLWNWLVGTHLKTPYPDLLVDLYSIPLTRFFLLGLVILSAMWCPTVGILAAFAYITLGGDILFVMNRS